MIAMYIYYIFAIFIIMQNFLYADYESCSKHEHTTALHDLFLICQYTYFLNSIIAVL